MEIASPGGESHMAEVRTSGSGLVCFQQDYALPALVFPVSSVASGCGRSGSRMAQDQSLYSDMVLGIGQSVSWPSVGGSPQTRPTDSVLGHNLASPSGFMEIMGVAPERRALMCSGLSAEITDTILNSRALSTRCLYALKIKLFAS